MGGVVEAVSLVVVVLFFVVIVGAVSVVAVDVVLFFVVLVRVVSVVAVVLVFVVLVFNSSPQCNAPPSQEALTVVERVLSLVVVPGVVVAVLVLPVLSLVANMLMRPAARALCRKFPLCAGAASARTVCSSVFANSCPADRA